MYQHPWNYWRNLCWYFAVSANLLCKTWPCKRLTVRSAHFRSPSQSHSLTHNPKKQTQPPVSLIFTYLYFSPHFIQFLFVSSQTFFHLPHHSLPLSQIFNTLLITSSFRFGKLGFSYCSRRYDSAAVFHGGFLGGASDSLRAAGPKLKPVSWDRRGSALGVQDLHQ